MNVIGKTVSLCPECLRHIDASLVERDGRVYIEKECKEHGRFSDLYYGDYEMYKKVMKWLTDGRGVENPNSDFKGCPESCGLCKMHKSHTALANIVVTNRCDLACFYCFFYAKAMGYVYEPSLDQIRNMFKVLRKERPIPPKAIQLTGGEPLMRPDIVDIIRTAKEEGFDHVQLNTNGVRLSKDQELTAAVRKAGVNTIYLSFDGVGPKTNPKNHWEIPGIFDNMRKVGMGAVLVPTVIRGVNDHEVGDILRFGVKNLDMVRGINYQPVSLVGRITRAERERMRITIPDVIKRMEEQTDGMVASEDFYPVPTVYQISKFAEALSGKPKYELTAHSVCGMATYLFKDGERMVPITRFVDVEGLIGYMSEIAQKISGGKSKLLAGTEILMNLGKYIDKKKQPKDLKLANIIFDVLKNRNYNSLRTFHHKALFVGMMHFQDLYNYDIERVKRCCIHYVQPDGRIVPFCAFNVIPQWYRDEIQKKYSLPIAEWEKQAGKKISDDLYKRDTKKLEASPLYAKTYAK